MALVLRKKKDGTTHLMGGTEFPDNHEFSARWMQKAVCDGLATVTVTLHMAEGDHTYQFTGFAELPEETEEGMPKLNFTGWRCSVEGAAPETLTEVVAADDADGKKAATGKGK